MHRVGSIVTVMALIAMMCLPTDGSTQNSATTLITLRGTGVFAPDCVGNNFSGNWKFDATAYFHHDQDRFTFKQGNVSATLYLIDGRIRTLTFVLDYGLYNPHGDTGTRIDLAGSFVFPDNNSTYNVNIYGVVMQSNPGVMLSRAACP